MTEAEWQASEDTDELIAWVLPRAGQHEMALFAAACCRRCWGLLAAKESRDAVQVAERFADGGADHWQCGEAVSAARKAAEAVSLRVARRKLTPAHQAAADAVLAGMNHINPASLQLMSRDVSVALGEPSPNAHHARLLRDVCDPFTPDAPALAGRSGLVTGLARAAYRERLLPSGHLDPARLAVLSDALEDADCTDAGLLGHLRGPGPHVRGCWALDLVLGQR